ncbi:MAG: sigma-70 family RNA polymerase sigma factor [Candidatus Acidiferrales bacterium]
MRREKLAFTLQQEISNNDVVRKSFWALPPKNKAVGSDMSATPTMRLQPLMPGKNDLQSKTQKLSRELTSRLQAKSRAAGEELPMFQRWIARDHVALSSLFTRDILRLYRSAFSILRNREDAEDALQTGMLSAYMNLSSFEGRSSLSTWVKRIVINTALRNRRKQRAAPQLSLDTFDNPEAWVAQLVDPRPDPEHICALTEAGEFVAKGMDQLSPALRSTFQLRYIVDLSACEAARAGSVNISISATKSRACRARKQLARLLQARGVNLWRSGIH